MGRPKKLTENTSKNFTKEELLEREQAEARLSEFKTDQLAPPEYLDEIATEEYNRILPQLLDLPISNLDYAQIAAYCGFYSDFVKASIECNKEGLIIADDKGNPKLSPAFNAKEKASIRMERTASTLGLTVDSRLKILTPKKEENKDPFSKFASDD